MLRLQKSLAPFRNVVVLTGAGVSAASGLATYRGAGGMWNNPADSELSTLEAWQSRPQTVWAFFRAMHANIAEASPNSTQVLELHGSLHRLRCDSCDSSAPTDLWSSAQLPKCEQCGDPIRPDIVFFGEHPHARPEHLTKRALRDCDLIRSGRHIGNGRPGRQLRARR